MNEMILPQNAMAPALVELFAEFSNEDLVSFDQISKQLHINDATEKESETYTIDLESMAPVFLKYNFLFSRQSYLQFTSWLISTGKQLYYEVRNDPEIMIDYIEANVPRYIITSFDTQNWIRDEGFDSAANAVYFERNNAGIPGKRYLT